ncbi:MAG: tetratricopeptide repeat protein [Phycisphaeraceae bacterium]|nr:tetratricopeptide repeat protein [Phycisphaeraceae bacterium]
MKTRPGIMSAAAVMLGVGLVFSGVGVAGCAKQGKHTTKHVSAAKEKMASMKAATEFQMASQAFYAGDLEKARRHADFSVSLNDKVAKTHVLRGRIFLEMNDLDKATGCFEDALTRDPNNAEAEYFQGVLAERVARHERALNHYLKAAVNDQTNPQYCIAAAEVMVDLGRLDEAKRYLSGFEERFINNAGIRQVLGHIALLERDLPAAELFFGEARLLAPDDDSIAESLARVQMDLGKFAEAERTFARLLTVSENTGRRDLMHVRAHCLVHLQRYVEAREIYVRLTRDQAGSADADAWRGLGQVAYVLRDNMRLKTAATRLTAIQPRSADGHVLRGLLARRMGEQQEALAAFQIAVGLDQSSESLVLLGMTQQDLRMIEQARQSYRAALQRNPNDAAAAQLLAAIGE